MNNNTVDPTIEQSHQTNLTMATPNHNRTSLERQQSSSPTSRRRDVTSTPLYKEIYANNIRHYSYIVARQLGSGNLSPQQLRKLYLQHQQKATQCHATEHMTSNMSSFSSHCQSSHVSDSAVTTNGDSNNVKAVKDDKNIDYRKKEAKPDGHQSLRAAAPLAYRSCQNFEERRKKKGSMCEISKMNNNHKVLVEKLSNTTYLQKHDKVTEKKPTPLETAPEDKIAPTGDASRTKTKSEVLENVEGNQSQALDVPENVGKYLRQTSDVLDYAARNQRQTSKMSEHTTGNPSHPSEVSEHAARNQQQTSTLSMHTVRNQRQTSEVPDHTAGDRRHDEADERHRRRVARLNSLDTMVLTADLFMKKNDKHQPMQQLSQSLPSSARLSGPQKMREKAEEIEGEEEEEKEAENGEWMI